MLGHGLITILFGGRIEGLHISLISPLDTSHITLDQNNLTYEQYLLVVSGGMVVDLTLPFLLQIVPFNIVLYIFKTGLVSNIIIGLVPVIVSYLLEFQILPMLEENKTEPESVTP